MDEVFSSDYRRRIVPRLQEAAAVEEAGDTEEMTAAAVEEEEEAEEMTATVEDEVDDGGVRFGQINTEAWTVKGMKTHLDSTWNLYVRDCERARVRFCASLTLC